MQEREGTSLETQEAACRRHAAAGGYSVLETHVFRETYSGAEFHDRPRLAEGRFGNACYALIRVGAPGVFQISTRAYSGGASANPLTPSVHSGTTA